MNLSGLTLFEYPLSKDGRLPGGHGGDSGGSLDSSDSESSGVESFKFLLLVFGATSSSVLLSCEGGGEDGGVGIAMSVGVGFLMPGREGFWNVTPLGTVKVMNFFFSTEGLIDFGNLVSSKSALAVSKILLESKLFNLNFLLFRPRKMQRSLFSPNPDLLFLCQKAKHPNARNLSKSGFL